MKRRNSIGRPLIHRIILTVLAVLVVASLIVAYTLYRYIYAPNTDTGRQETYDLYIMTGESYAEVLDSLDKILINTRSFRWLADKKQYPGLVKPGRYVIHQGMSNLALVNKLRSGDQQPVNVIFNSLRSVEQLAGTVSRQLEMDSASLARLLNDESFLENYQLDRYSAMTLFIPNTYQFYWNTDARQFVERMHKENERFWTAERTAKAEAAGMSRNEVVTLASIVEKETNKNDEKAKIAGVYINRLRQGWPLQADPTVVYATGDFTATRVLNKHTRVDSPYNTYKYKGLPPGPICIPSISSIDAVLDYNKHDFMFFVASEDLSGYHVFSRTLREHNQHAKRYRKAVKEARENSQQI